MLPPVVKDGNSAVTYHPNLWLRRQSGGYRVQLRRRPPIVAIQECNDLPCTLRNSRVERRRLPTVLLAQQPHVRLKFPHDLRSAVRRAIVNNYDFPLGGRKVLLEYAHDGLLDEAFVVVRIDENAYKWFWHRPTYAGTGKILEAPVKSTISRRQLACSAAGTLRPSRPTRSRKLPAGVAVIAARRTLAPRAKDA